MSDDEDFDHEFLPSGMRTGSRAPLARVFWSSDACLPAAALSSSVAAPLKPTVINLFL